MEIYGNRGKINRQPARHLKLTRQRAEKFLAGINEVAHNKVRVLASMKVGCVDLAGRYGATIKIHRQTKALRKNLLAIFGIQADGLFDGSGARRFVAFGS